MDAKELLQKITTYIDASDDRYRRIPNPDVRVVSDGKPNSGKGGAALVNGVWYPLATLRMDQLGEIYVSRKFMHGKACELIRRVIDPFDTRYSEMLNPDIQALYPASIIINHVSYPVSVLAIDMENNIFVSVTFSKVEKPCQKK